MKNFLYSLARNAERPRSRHAHERGRAACVHRLEVPRRSRRSSPRVGVAIKVCGTCLDFLGVKDELAVGEVGTMPESVAALIADDVLTIA